MQGLNHGFFAEAVEQQVAGSAASTSLAALPFARPWLLQAFLRLRGACSRWPPTTVTF